MIWFWISLGAALTLALFYLSTTAWGAKHDVDGSPKKDMYVCDIHGPMPADATHILFNTATADGSGTDFDLESPDGRTYRGPIRTCPICFENKIKQAGKK